MINWTLDNPFVLSLNLKDGDLGVTFPWTANFTRVWERSTMFRRYPGAEEAERMGRSPDEESFQALSKVFTSAHPLMKSSQAGCSTFRQEIEEGEKRGRREVFSGSLQDFTYLFSNCLEIAAHLGCVKKPLASSLQVSSSRRAKRAGWPKGLKGPEGAFRPFGPVGVLRRRLLHRNGNFVPLAP